MARIRTPYKPRPSAYSLAYQAILRDYQENELKPLTLQKVHRLFKCTPGVCFADGIRIEDVLETLSTWKLIFKGKIGGLEGECIVPLMWQ